jgi:hypothetical protein
MGYLQNFTIAVAFAKKVVFYCSHSPYFLSLSKSLLAMIARCVVVNAVWATISFEKA